MGAATVEVKDDSWAEVLVVDSEYAMDAKLVSEKARAMGENWAHAKASQKDELKACELAVEPAQELAPMTVGPLASKSAAQRAFGLGRAWVAHSAGSSVACWVDARARVWVEMSASHWAGLSAGMSASVSVEKLVARLGPGSAVASGN